ncbi:hypothetical protein M2191_004451 [Bradyrhizobium japonicum]|nr:hypothetical protein [Bradyrhizobium japonicum]
MMSSGPGRALSISTCHGSTTNGQPVAETALNFGAAYGRAVSEAPFVLSASGRLVDGGPKRLMSKPFIGFARLMTVGRDTLSKAETVNVAAVEAGVPPLVEAREIIAEFHLMIRRKTEAGLVPWIERARASLVASFARGVTNDEAAVPGDHLALVQRTD